MATTFDRHTTQTHTTGGPHFRYDRDYTAGDKLPYPQSAGPSGTKIMAIMALLPIGGILLGLAGLTFIGTIIGLALATPVFIIFSPVIVPAVLTIGLAVTGFLTSGTFGLTGLSSLSYLVTMLRHSAPYIREDMDYVKDRIQDAGEYVGQKTKETGQAIKDRAHDIGDVGQGGGYGANVHVGGGGAGVGGGVTTGGGKDRKEGGKGGDRT
ncbi:oleosin 18.2 kDa [Tanacetum coccineum]